MNFLSFKINSYFFLAPNEPRENIQEGILKNFFKKSIKFVAIGVAALMSLIITNYETMFDSGWKSAEGSTTIIEDRSISIAVVLSVISIGLIIDRFYMHYKKKKKRISNPNSIQRSEL